MALPARSPRRPVLPSRDAQARARLEVVGEQARPVVLAHERTVSVPGPLGDTLGALIRGSTVAIDGDLGAGATSLVFDLAAAVTAVGEWVAMVDLDASRNTTGRITNGGITIGAEAAGAAGVALERLAVIRRVPHDRWATVVAALLDGMSLVITDVPRHAHAGETRRLVARARERGAVLVTCSSRGPVASSVRITALGGSWHGLTQGGGLLARREHIVEIEAHGAQSRSAEIANVG